MRKLTPENYWTAKHTPQAKRMLRALPPSIDVNMVRSMRRLGNGRIEIIHYEKRGGMYLQRRDNPGLSMKRTVVRG